MAEKIIAQLRNDPKCKIDLLYDDDKEEDQPFVIRFWSQGTKQIRLTPDEFIKLLKAGLDYYEINGEAVKKLGLQIVK